MIKSSDTHVLSVIDVYMSCFVDELYAQLEKSKELILDPAKRVS